MRYMLLIYGTETELSQEDREACYEESVALTHDLHAAGQFISAAPLQSVTTATTVRIRETKPFVTDGPFAETREQLGGYFMVEAENLDEAIGIAKRIPGAKWGTVEIRPVVELGGMPEGEGS